MRGFSLPLWAMPDYLSEIITDDPVAAIELLEVYLEDAESRLGELRNCLLADNASAVGAITHNMIGSARQFGALRLADIAEQIETTVRNGEWNDARSHLSSATCIFQLLSLEVRRTIASIAILDKVSE